MQSVALTVRARDRADSITPNEYVPVDLVWLTVKQLY